MTYDVGENNEQAMNAMPLPFGDMFAILARSTMIGIILMHFTETVFWRFCSDALRRRHSIVRWCLRMFRGPVFCRLPTKYASMIRIASMKL